MSDLDFDLSRSLKVKCHGVIGLAICAFLMIVNSNIGPNLAPLQVIRLWNNVGDIDFKLSRSLKVKSNGAVGLSIYEFLLMSNSNHMYLSLFRRYGIKKFSLYLTIGPKRSQLTPGGV